MDQKGGFFVENFLRITKNKVYARALIQPTMKSFHINRLARSSLIMRRVVTGQSKPTAVLLLLKPFNKVRRSADIDGPASQKWSSFVVNIILHLQGSKCNLFSYSA